jgi:hypothetical protein
MKTLACTVALLVAILPFSAAAKDKHLPLPPQLLRAKTVYIENRSGQASIADRAYQALVDWGRLSVVQDRSQADVIFLLSYDSQVRGSRQHGRVDENGDVNTTSTPNVVRISGLTVLDAKTGDSLWSESKAASIFAKSAIKRAVDELRKRIEEQEAPTTKH